MGARIPVAAAQGERPLSVKRSDLRQDEREGGRRADFQPLVLAVKRDKGASHVIGRRAGGRARGYVDQSISNQMIATAIRVAAAVGLGGMAGLLGGLFGVGGGFLVIPLLGFFYGMDQQTAQGTALMMVVPNVAWAFLRYRRLFGIDLRMAVTIAGSALIAAYPMARLATGLDPHVLRLAFALFLATIAATVAYHAWRGASKVEGGPRQAWGWITVVGVIGGAFSGFFGVGGAFVAPPLLTTFFGLRQLEAQGLALALVAPSALLALWAYAGAGEIDSLVGLPLALGGIAAIPAGVKFASRLPERRMRLAFCGLLLLTAVLLALRG